MSMCIFTYKFIDDVLDALPQKSRSQLTLLAVSATLCRQEIQHVTIGKSELFPSCQL